MKCPICNKNATIHTYGTDAVEITSYWVCKNLHNFKTVHGYTPQAEVRFEKLVEANRENERIKGWIDDVASKRD